MTSRGGKPPRLRDLVPADLDWLLALNNAAVPDVNRLDRQALAVILAIAGYGRAVVGGDRREGRPVGGLLAIWPGADYGSSNYRWFAERFDHFLYVDRVMVAEDCRGGGVGRRLYGDLEDFARGRTPRIACEVNSEPPNPASMRFHQAAGFRPVGEQVTEGGTKRVILMIKTL